MQLQASIKYGWTEKYLWIILLVGMPNTWLYMQSVNHFITAFNGSLWESRILGFSIGVMVFAAMGSILFGETLSAKTGVSLLLAACIVLIQIFWK
jgi:EamA domain-containing membrane protein RarD